MKRLKTIVAVCVTVLLFASCKNSFDLTKRHYTKGYYFHKSRSLDQPKTTEGIASIENKVADLKPVIHELPKTQNKELRAEPKDQHLSYGFSPNTTNGDLSKAAGQNQRAKKSLKAKKAFSSIQQKTGPGATQKHKNTSGAASEVGTVLLIILCILLPPLAVYIKENAINNKFWIDLILTLLFWLPGIIYAFYVCFA